MSLRDTGTVSKRHYVHQQGHKIYEWEQDIEEIHCYIEPPPGLRANSIECVIISDHIKIGIKGNPAFIDETLGGICKVSDSYWTLEDGILHITLTKASIGSNWPCFTTGHPSLQPNINALSSNELEQDQQTILLQRMQREHPSFDFSNAAVNGVMPDPAKFMDGIDRTKM